MGKTIAVKKGDDRGVFVDNVKVFSQEHRFAKDGVFQHDFSALKLR